VEKVLDKNFVIELGKANGFLTVGFSKAQFLEKESTQLEKWLSEGKHGKMNYMTNHFDLRMNPQKLLIGSKTVISFLFNYFPGPIVQPYKIARYALGIDYHLVLKEKMYQIILKMQEKFGSFEYQLTVDSAPVFEKAWAVRSGLGWMGKHTNVIRKKTGSWFFLSEIVTDLVFEPDTVVADHCGTCTKCIDACPTEALKPYELDANKCISYLTIELKEMISEEYQEKLSGWVFGCDICQEVCPWNRHASISNEESWKPGEWLTLLKPDILSELSNRQYLKTFEKSPISRVKKEKMLQQLLQAEKKLS